MRLKMILCFVFGHKWEWSNYRMWSGIGVVDVDCLRCGFSSMKPWSHFWGETEEQR